MLLGGKFFAATTTGPDGTFSVARRISASGPYTARFGESTSLPVATTVKPLLDAKLVGSGAIGEPLAVVAKLLPASAGEVRIRVWRGVEARRHLAHATRVRLSTRTPGSFRIVVTSRANPGFASASRSLSALVADPSLSVGARGASVRALERRLVELHYALKGVDGFFGQ